MKEKIARTTAQVVRGIGSISYPAEAIARHRIVRSNIYIPVMGAFFAELSPFKKEKDKGDNSARDALITGM